MNDTEENTCRLCLKTIHSNHFHLIEDVTMQMIDNLLLKLELNTNIENVMCSECATDLQKSFEFKLACVSLKDKELISTKDSPRVNSIEACLIEDGNDPLDNRKPCQFCQKPTQADNITCLNETKENMLVVDMLQQHIPELELNIPEELISCEVCLKSLQHLLNFTTACSYAKQKLKQCSKTEVTDDNAYKAEEMFIKIEEEFIMKTEANDESMQADNLDASDDEKITEVKFEQRDSESDPNATGSNTDACNRCPFEAENQSKLRSLLVAHQSVSELIMYKCDHCSFETKEKSHLQQHTLMHITDSEIPVSERDTSHTKMYSCPICFLKMRHIYNLREHMLIHKDPSVVPMYKCELCSFETKYKRYVKTHMLTHTSPSETTMPGCEHPPSVSKKSTEMTCKDDYCSFKTKYKCHLQAHALMHKTPPEITMFKCDICEFETKYKSCIKRHTVKHKDRSEIELYSCPVCSREFKHKHNVRDHMLLHQNPSDIPTYKCEMCTYKTRHKSDVKRHMRTHSTLGRALYRCEYCPFKSKYKRVVDEHSLTHDVGGNRDAEVAVYRSVLTSHKLIHKNSETKTYKCDLCPYSTTRNYDLKRHMLTHKDPMEVTMYKCNLCVFETKHKNDLTCHMLTHKDSSEVTMYRCETCAFQTRHKYALTAHMAAQVF